MQKLNCLPVSAC